MPLIKSLALIFVLYIIFEFGLFWFKYSHLPTLPTINQTEQTPGFGVPIRYIAAGDSTAVGAGASGQDATYAYQVAQYLAKSDKVFYKNVAVKGATTKDVLDKQLDSVIAYRPDVITISMGANDATHLVSEKNILDNYKHIISQLESRTTAIIYLTDIPNFNGAGLLPWFYIKLIEFRSAYINKNILALEDKRVKIVDIHNFGWNQAQYSDRSKTYAADNFHPNDLGYQNWTNAFLDKMKQQ